MQKMWIYIRKKNPYRPSAAGLIIFSLIFICSLFPKCIAKASDSDTGHISGDIFERRVKWYRASLSLSESYDDNIFNANESSQSDYITIITPTIEFSLPETRHETAEIYTDTTTPGGLVFGQFSEPVFHRLKIFAGYSPIFQFYQDNSDENLTSHFADAGIQYNMRGGLSIDLSYQFVQDFDRREADRSTQTDDYSSNFANLMLQYALTEKFYLRADLSNYRVYYDIAEEQVFRDRTDRSASGYIFYRPRAKTSVFVEYRYIDIDYKNDNARDGEDQHYLIGIVYDITDKTNVSFRAGYGIRQFSETDQFDEESLLAEGSVYWRYSPKTNLRLDIYHRNEESPFQSYNNITTTALLLNYQQQLSPKISFETDITYRHENYDDVGPLSENENTRNDDFVSITPSLTYHFRKWFSASLAYEYRNRNSDDELDSFTGNNITLKITGYI